MHDLRAAVVPLAVDVLDLEQLLADQPVDSSRIAEDRAQLGDALDEVFVFLLDLVPLERGERTEPEVEDRLRLDLAEFELLHELRACFVDVVCAADERYDRVQ